jgi:hypothetical protein
MALEADPPLLLPPPGPPPRAHQTRGAAVAHTPTHLQVAPLLGGGGEHPEPQVQEHYYRVII